MSRLLLETADREGYTQLSDMEEKLFALDPFFLSPFAMLLAILIIGVLVQHSKSSKINKKNEYYLLAIKCAISSALCSIFACIIKSFFCNNLFISWNYEAVFVTITDSFSNVIYFSGKVLFYYGFTFLIQSIIYDDKHMYNNKIPLWLKIFMISVGLCVFITCIIWIYADVTENSLAEIGVTSTHNIYITLFNGHDGAPLSNIAASLYILIDMLYFGVLAYYYVSTLKKMNGLNEEGVKGFILMSLSSVIFWVSCIFVVTNSPLKYVIIAISMIVDDICLFLMFKCGTQIYQSLCGYCCNNCCAKIIYPPNYQQISNNDDDDM